MTRSALASIAIAAALAAASTAVADEHEKRGKPASVRVSGEALVRETPDQAEIEVGVTTSAKRAPDASSENAKKVEAVLDAVKKVLGEKANLRTAGYSLSPNQQWPEHGGTPTITGYTASNIVRARLTDLTKIGPVIDAAMEAGANQVHGLQFSLQDEEKVRERALALAAKRARAKADALADALGIKLGRIRAVEEVAAGGPPVFARGMAMAAMKAENAPTPIEAGDIDVSASVTLVVDIAE